MALTLRAVIEELGSMNGQPLDQVGRDEIVSAVARAALLGARGNSGVILSQIVRGAAEELASRPGELVDPILVSAAFARAADAAYASVRDPAEGTMLSAVRAMASRVAHDLAHMDRTRLGPDASAAEQDELLAEVLENALEAAQGGCRARPRAARGAARVGCRRRRRLRVDRDHRRLPRRAARRRRPRARAPICAGRAAPAGARVVELPLLHELRGHRQGPRRRAASRRCSSASATRCWSSATTARCACTCTRTSRTPRSASSRRSARSRASTSPTCTSRWPSARRASPTSRPA